MAKPKLALIPAAQGSKLFSVLPSSGVGDFDFSRSGEATRINSQGLIETVDDGVSRLNYPMIDGKVVGCPHHILEPARTNLETKSNGFSTWSVNSNITKTANYILSPDGTQNATRLQFTGNGYSANTSQSLATYTMSCYAKRNDSGTQNVGFFTNGSGVVNSAWEITSEWKRFSYTFPTLNGSFMGIAGDSGADISVYGFQIEGLVSYATSYIPTQGGSAVTRLQDVCNGAGNADIFNDNEGVLFAEVKALDTNVGTNRKIVLGDGSFNNGVEFSFQTTNNNMQFIIRSSTGGAGITMNIQTTDFDVTEFNKIAISYKSNEGKVFVNGSQVGVTDTSVTTPTGINKLDLKFSTSFDFNSIVKDLRVYNTALTDQELRNLTKV